MKRTAFFFGILGFVTTTAAAIGGCASFEADLCAYGICDAGASLDSTPNPNDASQDTKPDADPPPPGCETPTDPMKNPEKCLVDSFGAFVSPTGNDGDDGSKAKPFKTIGKALSGTRSRIVVCEGEYAGSLDITRQVEVYGGIACDFAKAGAKAKIGASKSDYGIKTAKASDTLLVNLEVIGIDATAPGASSVGVLVTESTKVILRGVKIEAGEGGAAAAKKDGAFTFPADALLMGGNADGKGTPSALDDTAGIGGSTGTCPGGGTSAGGKGGTSGSQGDDANPRPPGGLKGDLAACNAGGSGYDGIAGTNGAVRAGATTVGTLIATGYSGSPGQDGSGGAIGGGGGGGYGAAGAGGGGAAGGCGGEGGKGGGPGESSIALVSFGSGVKLEGTTLVAKAAKAGGAGGTGQTGQAGATGGNRSGAACNGGNGAKGGDGGSGGGGAGGIAVGIAWAGGTEPVRDGASTVTRPTGPAPVGGEGGVGATKGVDGVHADTLEVK